MKQNKIIKNLSLFGQWILAGAAGHYLSIDLITSAIAGSFSVMLLYIYLITREILKGDE